MTLKLFRSTGYSSILSAGETRVLLHPAWVVVCVGLWAGFACNVALWQALAAGENLHRALLQGWLVAAASAVFLSFLGWRRTLKPAATLVLLLAALSACGTWSRGLPLDASLFGRGPTALLPTWASLLDWQMPVVLAITGVLPMLWLWSTELRRLPGPAQLRVNVIGIALALGVGAGALYLLAR